VIEFGILGPLVVRANVGEIRVEGVRRRALLVRLVASAGCPIPAERLADDLWEGAPPAGAKSTLSSHISLLRGLLGPDRIWSRDGGYVLKAAQTEIDACSFESEGERGRELLRKGRLQPASVLFEHALGRWRGNALSDVAGSAWALPDIARLEGLRRSTFEAWIDTRLALGEHTQVVPVIEAAVAEHPLQERLSAQLMLALYRAGRQADALGTYRKLKTLLGEELGIVPSAELTSLEEAVVLQDPGLTWRRPSIVDLDHPGAAGRPEEIRISSRDEAAWSHPNARSAQDWTSEPRLASDLRWLPPSTDPSFMGRTEQLERLEAEWQGTVFRPRLAVVAGNAGIGKTRLVGEAAKRIDAKGGMVLFGRCDEEATRPCQPFGEVFDYLASALKDDDFFTLVAPYADGLSYLSRPTSRRLGIDPPQLSPDVEADRYRLLDAVSSFFAAIGAFRALFLVIDDLQWADPLTLVVVRHLLSRLDPTPVTIVATARDEEPEDRQTVAGLAGRLDRAVSSTRLEVSGLTEHDVESLVRHHEGIADQANLISEIWRVTRGNPFFVLQIARQLEEQGSAPTAEPAGSGGLVQYHVPQRVHELIDLRISKLTGDSVALMTAGSIFGEQFALNDAAHISELDSMRSLSAVDELLAARLVTAHEGDTYRFDHELVRRTVYESLAPARRLRLHRQAGERLAGHPRGRVKVPIGEIAHHFSQAAALGPEEVEMAALWTRKAGDSDFSKLAFESAARNYELALEFVSMLPVGDSSLSALLSLRLGRSLNGAGETEKGKLALHRAFDFARLAGRSELKAAAALDYGGSLPLATNVDDVRPSQMLKETLGYLDAKDWSTRARCLSRLALWQYRSAPRPVRQALCAEALRLAHEADDPQVLAAVLHDRSWALFGPDDCRDQLDAGTQMVAIGETLDDAEMVLHGQQCRLHALLELGPADETKRTGDEVARLANTLHHPAHLWSSTAHKALCAASEGRFLEAEDLAETALRLHRPSDQVQALVAYGTQRFQRHWLEGRLSEDRQALHSIIERSPDRLSMISALLWTEIEIGEVDAVRNLLDRIAAAGWASIPKDLEWWPIIVSSAIAAHLLRDEVVAKELYQEVCRYREHNCVSAGIAFFGNAEHVLGLLSEVSGELERAEDHLQSAIRRYDEWNAVPFAALCRRDLGLILLRGDEQSRSEGRRLLEKSLLDAERLGMASLLSDIRSVGGVAGVTG
jgi:DNA-binding SARP family transcriptional activator/tetratricopeptide (TPR) repeat protein